MNSHRLQFIYIGFTVVYNPYTDYSILCVIISTQSYIGSIT